MKKTNDEIPGDNPLSIPKNKLYKTINNESLVTGIEFDDLLFRCGELQLDFNDTCNLCADHMQPGELMAQLCRPESNYYIMYMNGVSNGKLKMGIDLEHLLSDPKAKDAYKNLSAERRRQSINLKLTELFGLEGL